MAIMLEVADVNIEKNKDQTVVSLTLSREVEVNGMKDPILRLLLPNQLGRPLFLQVLERNWAGST